MAKKSKEEEENEVTDVMREPRIGAAQSALVFANALYGGSLKRPDQGSAAFVFD